MKSSKQEVLHWGSIGYLGAIHAVTLFCAPLYFVYAQLSQQHLWIIPVILLAFVNTWLGIGMGFHRLYSHHAFKAHWLVRICLIFLGTLTGQGSIIAWSCDHRYHHEFVDTDRDPYNVKRSFCWAHIGWMLHRRTYRVDNRNVKDLMKDPMLAFQHRHYVWLVIASNFLYVAVTAVLLGSWIGGFLFGFFVRICITYNVTWLINSAAHYWGEQTYSKMNSARDWFLGILMGGEQHRNYHHAFAADYRNGIKWYHLDFSKWVIWSLSKVGLTWDLKRYDEATIRRALLRNDIDWLKGALPAEELQRSQFQDRIRLQATRLKVNIEKMRRLLKDREEALIAKREEQVSKMRQAHRQCVKDARRNLRRLRKAMRPDWESWNQLCHDVRTRQVA